MKNNGFLWKQVKDLKKERDEYKNTCEWQNTEYIKLQKAYKNIADIYNQAQKRIEFQNAIIEIHKIIHRTNTNNLTEERDCHEQDLTELNTVIETQNIKLARDIDIIKNLKN